MTFKVVRDRIAQSDIEDFGRYATITARISRASSSCGSIAFSPSISQKRRTHGIIFT